MYRNYKISFLTFIIVIALGSSNVIARSEVQFNTDVLDLNDRSTIDLTQFSRAGYIMPGVYSLALQINKSSMPEHSIQFIVPDDDPKGSVACLTLEIVEQLGLTEEASRKLTWWHNNECLAPASLPGMTLTGDLGNGTLQINLPQAYLEYTAENWDPPSRWDEGIAGIILDYNLNSQIYKQQQGGQSQSIGGNGVTGMNLGAWRMRADWNANYNHTTGQQGSTQQNWNWNRYYLYRAVASMRAKFTAGEDYLNSGMFDSFRYTGFSLISDDNMLPPNLRGYAPEVSGVAKTNAKVTISQQGRTILETVVAAGPFRIQDLSSAVSGELDVLVTEQDGSTQKFQVNTASIPYLTRPGLVRYKVATGKPSNYQHHSQGPLFSSGEFSWGVSNGWSLFGGGLFAGDYNALALGVGRDLLAFGAISFDVTQSRAVLPNQDTKQGGSYRVSYSKRFDETDSQVTFAGYRFSERDFMSMSQYLDTRYRGNAVSGGGKELYTISLSQQLRQLNASMYLSYSHQTYWDRPANDRYNLSISSYFDFWKFRNLSLSLSAYRTIYNKARDDGGYMSISIPWGDSGRLGYGASFSGRSNSHSASYSDQLGSNDSYTLNTGLGQDGQVSGSGYYSREGDLAQLNLTGGFESSRYSSIGMSMRGGMTGTIQGAALHRVGNHGGGRMLVDTDGVKGVPVKGTGSASSYTNLFGKAVVSDMPSYYRTSVNVDLDNLGDDAEATRSVVQATLTEGAIGYRRFGIISGQKAMAVVRLADGSFPPFGATVLNRKNDQTGIVSEEGLVWLSGIIPGEQMNVNWGGDSQCKITLPPRISAGDLLLPCM